MDKWINLLIKTCKVKKKKNPKSYISVSFSNESDWAELRLSNFIFFLETKNKSTNRTKHTHTHLIFFDTGIMLNGTMIYPFCLNRKRYVHVLIFCIIQFSFFFTSITFFNIYIHYIMLFRRGSRNFFQGRPDFVKKVSP